MSVALWVLLAWNTLAVVVTVAMVGRERDPITPAAAAISVALFVPLLVWVLASEGVL